MPTMLNRTGTVLKKCDRTNHRPESNASCASGTCQHTCEPAAVEKCPHRWTLRYWVDGKQREKSFQDQVHPATGRTIYGSGRKLAQDDQLKLTVAKKSGDVVFADHGKSGKQNFGDAAEKFIERMQVRDSSKRVYTSVYRTHVKPRFGGKTLTQVANDLDGVTDLLAVEMKNLSDATRQQARLIIVGTVEYAVKSGSLSKHRLAGIELAQNGTRKHSAGFVFPTFEQIRIVADGIENPDKRKSLDGTGICVWLMRGCGLRIREALAVRKEDFREGGTVLRVRCQASRDGRTEEPLKSRKQGDFRDVPVPTWLWELVKDMPNGVLMPGSGDRPYQGYQTILRRFNRAAEAAGVTDEDFTPHSLRHAYASAMLARGVQITELAQFLGHKDINTTHETYGHLLPSAAKRAVKALDDEYKEWSTEKV